MKYHVPTGFCFSSKASGFYPFGDATALAGEGGVRVVVWLIQASACHAAALTTGAKHWHRQKAVFCVFVSAPQYLSTEPLCRTNRRKDVENLLKCCRNFSYTEYFP
ncbi:MAG: hypothetical protein SPE54_08785 [Sodaliphilus sp.]|nr:hypothetical protein [Sodaliphilus sp.]